MGRLRMCGAGRAGKGQARGRCPAVCILNNNNNLYYIFLNPAPTDPQGWFFFHRNFFPRVLVFSSHLPYTRRAGRAGGAVRRKSHYIKGHSCPSKINERVRQRAGL